MLGPESWAKYSRSPEPEGLKAHRAFYMKLDMARLNAYNKLMSEKLDTKARLDEICFFFL